MANEATVNCSLQISKGNLKYQSRPTSFRADVSGTKGPSPGAVTVPTAGVDIDLSALTTPALCRLMNLDSTNRVSVGVHDGAIYHPLVELLAGESFVLRLARDLTTEYGTGTGGTNTLHARANTASVVLVVEAFEQ